MKKRILFAMVAVVVGVPLLVTAWFGLGGIETASLPDDADLLWAPPEVADEDNAFVATLTATNLVKLATDDFGFERSIVDGYADLGTHCPTSRELREDQSAVEKADRILADNAAFYAAFAEGLERKAYSSKKGNLDYRAFALTLLELRLWAFKAQREADRGEWDAAVSSLEVLCRFGRLVSNNAADLSDLELGAIAEDLVLRKIVDLAAVEGIGENMLLSLAALAGEDEAAYASNCVRTVRGSYTELVSEMPKKSAADLLRFLDCDSPFRRICPVLECWPFYRGFAFDARWTRRHLADVAHAFLRGETDLATDEKFCPPINPFACNWLGRNQVKGFALSCRDRLKGSRVDKWVTLLRTRARIAVAVARWRLAHGGQPPTTLDALVPQYLPAMPTDPWSEGGKPLGYDASSGFGIVWTVGESSTKCIHGRNLGDCCLFRPDGKPMKDNIFVIFEGPWAVDTKTKVLYWLKAHQCEDGSWRDGDNPAASTALAVLAYLSCGETPGRTKKFGVSVLDHPVALASEYLIGYVGKLAAAQGETAQRDETALPIVACALSKGWDLTKNPNLKEAAYECLDLVVKRSRKLPADAKSVGLMDDVMWSALALEAGKWANITVEGLVECHASLTNYLARCNCDENSYYVGQLKFWAAMRPGSTEEEIGAWRSWIKTKIRDCNAAFVEEPGNGNTWKRGYFDFPASSPNSTGLGTTADSSLAVQELMIGGGGFRWLPRQKGRQNE